MAYKHGTYQKEGATNFQLPIEVPYGYFIVGTAPINQVEKANRTINEVKRISTPDEAISYFGGTGDLSFTISQAIKVFFELYAVAPIYVVNVLDPEKHNKVVTKNAIDVVDGFFTIPSQAIMTETLIVSDNATSVPIADVVTEWVTEGLKVYTTATKVDVKYKALDPTKVTKDEIIGGYNLNTMKRTGLELIHEIYIKFSELPAFIDTPGFSHDSEVAAILETKARSINGGMFESIPLINAPLEKRYDELVVWKEDNNINDNDEIVLYGAIKLGEDIYHQSIHYAALSLLTDADSEGVPCATPSNKAYKMDALLWKNANGELEELRLDREMQANFLNYNGVITAINFKGWRCWGSETALNPMATDPKDKYVTARRMFKYVGNQFVISHFNDVDELLTPRKARTMLESMNAVLRGWQSAEYILDGDVAFSATENNLITAFNGDFTFDIKLGLMPFMKSITFKKQMDKTYLETFLSTLMGGN